MNINILKRKFKVKINGILTRLALLISRKLYFNLVYFKHRGRLPNLDNPKDLSEIIMSDLYSKRINNYADYADKVKARDFWTDWGYGDYLPKLYGVWDSADKIDFSILPEKFALKVNHGCGSHIICTDKSKLDKAKSVKLMAKNLRRVWGKDKETHYALIKPLVYAEEYIDCGTGKLPEDIKFICCDGVIKCIELCIDRTADSFKIALFDTKWNRLDYARDFVKTDREIERPKSLDKMIEIAADVAKKFDHVRVDFFQLPNGKVYVGELTFSPSGGVLRSFTTAGIEYMGHSK